MATVDAEHHELELRIMVVGGACDLLLSGLRGVPVAARDYLSRQQFTVASVSSQVLDTGLFNGYRGYRRKDLLETITLGQ